jgi:uncharacterized protein
VKVSGEKTFEAPREEVWRVLVDPQSMARMMPGVESFDVEDDRHWTAHVKIRLGLASVRMQVHCEKVEERPPEYARLAAHGDAMRTALRLETSFELDEEAPGRTHMRWSAEVSLGGPLGALGGRGLEPLVHHQVSNVLRSIEDQLGRDG